MLSLEQICARKIAVQLTCNNMNVFEYNCELRFNLPQSNKIIHKLPLPNNYKKKIIGLINVIGMELCKCPLYRIRINNKKQFFNSNDFLKFLKRYYFTYLGTINMKKKVDDLMKENIKITDKFILACLYYPDEEIKLLHELIPEESKQELHNHLDLPIVKFWLYYLKGDIEQISTYDSIEEFRLQSAIKSESRETVEHCLLTMRCSNALAFAAQNLIHHHVITCSGYFNNCCMNDGLIDNFSFGKMSGHVQNMLISILKKMTQEDVTDFCNDGLYENRCNKHVGPINLGMALLLLVHWPHAHYFMNIVKFNWNFLPKWIYFEILKYILRIIVYCEDENKAFDYVKLFYEFFNESPEDYKCYIFSKTDTKDYLYHTLFNADWFDSEDYSGYEIALILLKAATDEERKDIINSFYGKSYCVILMRSNDIQLLDLLVHSLSYEVKINNFKEELMLSTPIQNLCYKKLIDNDMYDLNLLIEWSNLSKEKICLLKKYFFIKFFKTLSMMIFCEDYNWLKLFSKNDETASVCCRVVDWCAASKEELEMYKAQILFDKWTEHNIIYHLYLGDQTEVNTFLAWGLPDIAKLEDYLKKIADTLGISVCKELLSDKYIGDVTEDGIEFWSLHIDSDIMIATRKLVNLLTWFFLLEDKVIRHFKTMLLQNYGEIIYYHYTVLNKDKEANELFWWLGHCNDEITSMKERFILNGEKGGGRLLQLVNSLGPYYKGSYCKVYEIIFPILKSYLSTKDVALKFKEIYKTWNCFCNNTKKSLIYECLDLIIEDIVKYCIKENKQLQEEDTEETRLVLKKRHKCRYICEC